MNKPIKLDESSREKLEAYLLEVNGEASGHGIVSNLSQVRAIAVSAELALIAEGVRSSCRVGCEFKYSHAASAVTGTFRVDLTMIRLVRGMYEWQLLRARLCAASSNWPGRGLATLTNGARETAALDFRKYIDSLDESDSQPPTP